MNKDFQSQSGEPLSNLWVMLNQLNSKVNAVSSILSPYPRDGKSDLYDSMVVVYAKCKIRKLESEQVIFLEQTLQKIEPVLEGVPNRHLTHGQFWGMSYEEYRPKRDQFKEIILQAHKEAPIL